MPISISKNIDLTKIIKDDIKKIEGLSLLSKEDRKRIGNVIIKRIRERTQDGKGVTPQGRQYKLGNKGYTREYADKKGVRRGDVDLTLSGDMLENMYIKNTGVNKISIAVRKQDYGKLRGAEEGIWRNKRDSKGKPIPGTRTLLKRPFFNLSPEDREAIKKDPVFENVFKRAIKRLKR